jgi:hypothetical protein
MDILRRTTADPTLFGLFIVLCVLNMLQTVVFIVSQVETYGTLDFRRWKLFSQLLLALDVSVLILIVNGTFMHLAENDYTARSATNSVSVFCSSSLCGTYVYYIFARTKAILEGTPRRMIVARWLMRICIFMTILAPTVNIVQLFLQVGWINAISPIVVFAVGFFLVAVDVFYLINFIQYLRNIKATFRGVLSMEQMTIAKYGIASSLTVMTIAIWYTTHVLTGTRQGYGMGLIMFFGYISDTIVCHILIQMKWRLENRNWIGRQVSTGVSAKTLVPVKVLATNRV